MMRSPRRLLTAMILGLTGCVSVKTPDVQVEVNRLGVYHSESSPDPAQAQHAEAYQRVIRQETKVAKELNKRDWKEVTEETIDLTGRIRELSGYAHTSRDPRRFRGYCEQLLAATKSLDQAARVRDAAACDRSLNTCTTVLDAFGRDFPPIPPTPSSASTDPPQPQSGGGRP